MWPWGHFAVAYLSYSLYSRGRFRRPPRPEPALAVFVGSQLPDVIDKPLAWFGVLPHGRSLAHSLLFAAVLIGVVYAASIVRGRLETATAFAIAYLSHLVTDLSPRFFLGYPFDSEFLLWPLLPLGTFQYSQRVFEPPWIVELVVTPLTDPVTFFALEAVLFALAIGLWYVDGCPGRQYVPRRGRSPSDR